RIVGACFVALALYVAYDSTHALWMREAPHRSIAGIALTAVSVVAMPILARAKRPAAAALNSGAMRADARQTEFCMYLSAIVLGELLLNALLGWWSVLRLQRRVTFVFAAAVSENRDVVQTCPLVRGAVS
ncbi:MAG: hypothetical protein NTW28_34395, partial [Candidatus Solibacter sp.]|nr:hypothetical protein [Candidatus Solibacter sp.]